MIDTRRFGFLAASFSFMVELMQKVSFPIGTIAHGHNFTATRGGMPQIHCKFVLAPGDRPFKFTSDRKDHSLILFS